MPTETKHEHRFLSYKGPLPITLPAGHTVQKCRECDLLRTVHFEHSLKTILGQPVGESIRRIRFINRMP